MHLSMQNDQIGQKIVVFAPADMARLPLSNFELALLYREIVLFTSTFSF
jgi:hypothetical protein